MASRGRGGSSPFWCSSARVSCGCWHAPTHRYNQCLYNPRNWGNLQIEHSPQSKKLATLKQTSSLWSRPMYTFVLISSWSTRLEKETSDLWLNPGLFPLAQAIAEIIDTLRAYSQDSLWSEGAEDARCWGPAETRNIKETPYRGTHSTTLTLTRLTS